MYSEGTALVTCLTRGEASASSSSVMFEMSFVAITLAKNLEQPRRSFLKLLVHTPADHRGVHVDARLAVHSWRFAYQRQIAE